MLFYVYLGLVDYERIYCSSWIEYLHMYVGVEQGKVCYKAKCINNF